MLDKQRLTEKFNKLDKSIKDNLKAKTKRRNQKTLDVVNNWLNDKENASSFLVAHVPITANAKAITEAINLIKSKIKPNQFIY